MTCCIWNDGLWDKLVIYRGPSFAEGLEWFDFVLQSEPQYEQNGFHTENLHGYLSSGKARVIGHITGVPPVRWNPNPYCYGKKLIEK